MEEVVKILMRRDGLSKEAAEATVKSFLEEAEPYIGSGDLEAVEDLLMSDLGLEPDYITSLLGY